MSSLSIMNQPSRPKPTPKFSSMVLINRLNTKSEAQENEQALPLRVILKDDGKPFVFYDSRKGQFTTEETAQIGLLAPGEELEVKNYIRWSQSLLRQARAPINLSELTDERLSSISRQTGEVFPSKDSLLRGLQYILDRIHISGWSEQTPTERGLRYLSQVSNKNYIEAPQANPYGYEMMIKPPKFKEVVLHPPEAEQLNNGRKPDNQVVLDFII